MSFEETASAPRQVFFSSASATWDQWHDPTNLSTSGHAVHVCHLDVERFAPRISVSMESGDAYPLPPQVSLRTGGWGTLAGGERVTLEPPTWLVYRSSCDASCLLGVQDE